jgi:phenylalanyl-tRNA synthetase alpha chain
MADHSNPNVLLAGLRGRLAGLPALAAAELEDAHRDILGRKSGALTALLKTLPNLAPDERRVLGAEANRLRAEFEAAFETRREALKLEATQAADAGTDLTMPGRARWVGSAHPVTRVMDEILDILHGLGFTRSE